MAEYLFSVQQKNRLQQKGVLKRFSIKCYGKQQTLEVMRAEKAEMFKTLKDDRTSKEYESWFLRYVPFENDQDKQKIKNGKDKTDGSKAKTTAKTTAKSNTKQNGTKKTKRTKKNTTKKRFFLF